MDECKDNLETKEQRITELGRPVEVVKTAVGRDMYFKKINSVSMSCGITASSLTYKHLVSYNQRWERV